MVPKIRYRRRHRRPASRDSTAHQTGQRESSFFGEPESNPFFQPAVQRKCAACEGEEKVQRVPEKKEEEKVQRSADKNEEEKVQRKESATATTVTAHTAANYISAINGKGQPLSAGQQSFYGNRMGADFSQVKVHTGPEAAASAKAINAQAYAYGSHIVFNEGKYQPEASEGKHLLAHELAHVVQQHGRGQEINRTCKGREIRKTTGCIGSGLNLTDLDKPSHEIYKFQKGCDDFIEGEEERFKVALSKIDQSQMLDIHGFASEEGSEEFNDALSCARSIKAAKIIAEKGILIGQILKHGEQVGEDPTLRSVVLNVTNLIDYGDESEPESKKAAEPARGKPPSCCIYTESIAWAKALKSAWNMKAGGSKERIAGESASGSRAQPDYTLLHSYLTSLGYSGEEVFTMYENESGEYMSVPLNEVAGIVARIQRDIDYHTAQLSKCDPKVNDQDCKKRKNGKDGKDGPRPLSKCEPPSCDRVVVPYVEE